jgi:pimeloyl-ACP methyl ester carboxylesterase
MRRQEANTAHRAPLRHPIRLAEVCELGVIELGGLDTSRGPWPGSHRSVAGNDVFVRSTPAAQRSGGRNREPAVYVHGLGGASTNFTDFAGLVAPWVDGVALDLPGFGRSGPAADGRYSIGAQANVVSALIQDMGRGPVHLVGNSMGGAIAIEIAARRPELVRTLTLISPAVSDLKPKRPGDLAVPLLMVPGLGARLLSRVDRREADRQARAVVKLCFAHPERVPSNRVDEATADVLARRDLPWAHDAFMLSLRGVAARYLGVGSRSVWRSLSQISAPSVVIWGSEDRLVDVARAPRVAAAMPHGTLLVLPDVGHVAQLEDPVMVARAFLSLIARAVARERTADMRS